MKYRILYKILNSNIIYNICGPSRQGNEEEYINHRNKQDGFYNKLEKSILKEGFRNPILVDYAKPNSKYKINTNNYCYMCVSNGGSRLYFAKKYNMDIPCIINDFSLMLDGIELNNENDIKKYYTDIPKKFVFMNRGLFVSKLPNSTI